MILGVGVDICQVERLDESYRRFGQRLLARILSARERHAIEGMQEAAVARLLARRFAAKEAVLKALGTGAREGLALPQVVIDHDLLGKPLASLEGAAASRLRALGGQRVHLSISDERDYAVAFALIEASA